MPDWMDLVSVIYHCAKGPSAQCKTQSQRGPEVLIQVQKTRLRAPHPFLYLPHNPLPQNTPLSPLAPASPLGPRAPGSPGQPRRMVSLLEPSRSRTFTSAEQYKHQLVLLSWATCPEGNSAMSDMGRWLHPESPASSAEMGQKSDSFDGD